MTAIAYRDGADRDRTGDPLLAKHIRIDHQAQPEMPFSEGCLSLWEDRKKEERVGLRVLLVWGRARVRGLSFFRRVTPAHA
jgi:hypothetical protein